MNLASAFLEQVRQRGDSCALKFEGALWSYQQLDQFSLRLARDLARLGQIQPGDRVGIWLSNGPEYVAGYLAIVRLGAVAVAIAPMVKGPEASHVLLDSQPKIVLTRPEIMEAVDLDGRACADVQFLVPTLSGLTPLVSAAVATIEERERISDESAMLVQVEEHDAASILYTSGTTGRQKGVVLTHGNLASNMRAVAGCLGAEPGDRHMLFLPLFHCFGQNFIMNTALATGGTLLIARRFQLEEVLLQAEVEKATHFCAVPTIFIHLLDHPDALSALACVRYFFSAAATMPVEVLNRFQEKFGRIIHEGYGLTETSPLASYNHWHAPRSGSIGMPIEGVEMRVKSEDGSPCSPGQWGEICIKGPNVMAGYYQNEESTRDAIRDGWFHSGDIGYVDEDGYYFLVDRKKDMINRAGFKVWPSEVEDALYQHPGVKECAVVGVPDSTLGERVKAYVTPHEGVRISEEQLQAHLGALLANYKVPESFVFDAVIPKSAAGKTLKRLLRQEVSPGPSAEGALGRE